MAYVPLSRIPRWTTPAKSAALGAIRLDFDYAGSRGSDPAGGTVQPVAYHGDQVVIPAPAPMLVQAKVSRYRDVINDAPLDVPVSFQEMGRMVKDKLLKTRSGYSTLVRPMAIRTGPEPLVVERHKDWSADSTNLTIIPTKPKRDVVPSASGLKFADIFDIGPISIQTPEDAAGIVSAGLGPDVKNYILYGIIGLVSYLMLSDSKKPKRKRARRKPVKRAGRRRRR